METQNRRGALIVVQGEENSRMFPTLSAAEIARLATHGTRRQLEQGEVLLREGDETTRFFVVLTGELEVFQNTGFGEEAIVRHGPGQFFGDVNMLSGRPSIVNARVSEAGEALEIDRESLRGIVQTDGRIGEILMRAFILRRVALMARGVGDVAVIGSARAWRTRCRAI